jgi:hypothetical protein
LRAGIRRAYGMDRFPIWIDQVQDWSGEIKVAGPCVMLRTTTGEWTVTT